MSALALLGRVQAHNDDFAAARESLEQARKAYETLNAPEAVIVEQFLDQLEGQIPAGNIDIPIDVNLEGLVYSIDEPEHGIDIDVIVESDSFDELEEEE